MAKKQKCRDCKECHRPGLSKFVRGYGRSLAFIGTLGASEVVNAAGRAATEICPICGHRMSLHEDRRGGVAR